MKTNTFRRLVSCVVMLVCLVPGCGSNDDCTGPDCPGNCDDGAVQASRLADMYVQLRQSTGGNASTDIEAGGESKLEVLGLGLELFSLGIEVWHIFHENDKFEEINRKLDQINAKLDVVNQKLDVIQRLLVEGLDALSKQLNVGFTDLKSFVANKAIQEQISVIKTYAFTTSTSGLVWFCTKDTIKRNSKATLDKALADWQSALRTGGPHNIDVVLQTIQDYIIPDILEADSGQDNDQDAQGALDVYVDKMIAALQQAESQKNMSYQALVQAYLSYERFYSTILYWEHTGATLRTELYNSLKMKPAAKDYLDGTFRSNIAKQNERFLKNGVRLVAAFYSYIPKWQVGIPCQSYSRILNDQQQLLARLAFFLPAYHGYMSLCDKGHVRLGQRMVLIRQEDLFTTTPWLAWGNEQDGPGYEEDAQPYTTVKLESQDYNVYFFPRLEKQFDIPGYPFEFGHLGIRTSQHKTLRYCEPDTNYNFDMDREETLTYHNWDYTTENIGPNRVFLNRNFIVLR